MKKYSDLVSAAIAFNAERGDQLIVENVSFDNEMEAIVEPTFLEKQAPVDSDGLRYLIIPIVFHPDLLPVPSARSENGLCDLCRPRR